MLLLSWIYNKEERFVFSTSKVAAGEEVPLEQNVVKDVCRLNSST